MSEEQQIEVEGFLEDIIQALDFSSLDQFLYGHMRTDMSFGELVSQVSSNGLDALSAENICTFFYDTFFYELSIARPIFLKMLVFTLLFSVIHRLLYTKNKYISDISFLTIYSSLIVLLMQSFFMVRDIAIEGIDLLITFLNALIPTYAVTLVFSGNSASGAMLYEMVFVLIYIIEYVAKNFLCTMIHVFILVLFLNQLFDEDKLSKIALFLENCVQLILKLSFGLVIGFSVVQSMLTPVKDRLVGNVMLSGLSSMPGVGSAVGTTGEIIIGCGMLIKNSVGVIGLVLLCVITIIPIVKIGCFWLMYHGLSMVLQPVADKRITECVYGVARGCDLYMKVLLYTMILFFILISVVSVATSFVY